MVFDGTSWLGARPSALQASDSFDCGVLLVLMDVVLDGAMGPALCVS